MEEHAIAPLGTPFVKEKINAKMKVFADEYLTGEKTGQRFNAHAAARFAGYNEQYGPRLLRHPALRQYIDKRLTHASMGAAEVLARFSEIARGQYGDILTYDEQRKMLVVDHKKAHEYRHLIKSFTFDSNGNPKIEFHDSHAALRDVARVRGMLKDGLEVSGPGGSALPVTMTVQFVTPDGSTYQPVPNPQLPAGESDDDLEEDWSDLEADNAADEGR